MQTWKPIRISIVLFFSLLTAQWALAFDIDLSRRRKDLGKHETEAPIRKESNKNFLDFFMPSEPRQEFVILNTEKGFVPAKVNLRKGVKYVISVVNVNDKEKNVSFILDAFSEHHATYYGKIKTFEIKPAQEGIFTFQCPETSTEGRLVVVGGENVPAERALSSETSESTEEK